MSDTTNHIFLTASIVSYNTAHLLDACITDLFAHLPVQHLVVMHHDHHPLPANTAQITHIRRTNDGFGAGHNAALTHIKKKFVEHSGAHNHIHLFLNPDTRITSSLHQILSHFNDPAVAATAPQLLDSTRGKDPYCAGIEPTALRLLCNKVRTPALPTTPQNIDWLSGAALFVRVNDVVDIGGFDTRYFLYYEDADLCKRLRAGGKRIIFDPTHHIIHDSGQSFTTRAQQKNHYDESQDYYFRTHHSPLHARAQRLLRTLWRRLS